MITNDYQLFLSEVEGSIYEREERLCDALVNVEADIVGLISAIEETSEPSEVKSKKIALANLVSQTCQDYLDGILGDIKLDQEISEAALSAHEYKFEHGAIANG